MKKELWTPDRSIRELPKDIRRHFIDEAGFLLSELSEQRLEVILDKAPDPRFDSHKVRKVINRNPKWYSEIYHSHKHFRRDRSLRALNRIYTLHDFSQYTIRFSYQSFYREFIKIRLIDGHEMKYNKNVHFQEGIPEVREYFGLPAFDIIEEVHVPF